MSQPERALRDSFWLPGARFGLSPEHPFASDVFTTFSTPKISTSIQLLLLSRVLRIVISRHLNRYLYINFYFYVPFNEQLDSFDLFTRFAACKTTHSRIEGRISCKGAPLHSTEEEVYRPDGASWIHADTALAMNQRTWPGLHMQFKEDSLQTGR